MAFAPPEVPLQRDILESSWPIERSLPAAPSHIQGLMPDSPATSPTVPYTFSKPASLEEAAVESITLNNEPFPQRGHPEVLSAIPVESWLCVSPNEMHPPFRPPRVPIGPGPAATVPAYLYSTLCLPFM